MKVLQINKFLKVVGGAETYMFQLSKALENFDIEIKFWGMYDEENTVSDFPGLEVETIDFQNQKLLSKLGSVIDTIYSKKNRKKIAKVLDSYQPDIVHIHNYNFQLTPSILPEIKKRGIKVVQTIHDSQMVCPYHRLYNFQRDDVCTKCIKGSFINCIKDRCFDGSVFKSTVGALESTFYHSLGYYNKYIDTYISPSHFLANLIKNRVKKEIVVIPNFTQVQYQPTPETPIKDYYLYYGRISDEKGVLELIELFKATHLHLIIVGKGPLEDQVIETIKDSSNIEFVGPKYADDLFKIVSQAKYVVQSSKWFENCPMTIIEAFSLGVPVIGSNHSGFIDLIRDKETGYLMDFSNKESAVKQLKSIDLNDVSKLKTNVRQYYDENLAENIHLEKIISVYKNVLNR
ncbi:glycosyltransferase family 4 protein [Psychroserpens sp. SPM9]|uniref:glycosyltransferase family 4 protein n=1 Tax=Psychroserpens sp. SPM9 TaxID=2975598 RepID=UPI0021A6372F|nr:glycosyltransferase family 4 protein [Psychroserpens sp. SPM9]MDG5491107.1 glycosyltransferase family 4 protein [Psychroserpens sp. SPM9]